MKLYVLVLILFASSLGTFGQGTVEADLNKEVTTYVTTVMDRYGIPGAAVAVVKEGKVLHEGYYGKASLEHNVAVDSTSVFRVYSLTKTFVATAVFQLLEQDKISLEDTVANYVDGLPKEWQSLQIKHLLTHASGLPDMAPIPDFEDLTEEEAKVKVFKEALKFPIGEKYDYNQTNFWLLQQIIEKVCGTTIEDFISKGQFTDQDGEPFFSSDSRTIINNRVTPYFPFRTGALIIDTSYLQGRYLLAANGLNITLRDYLEWDHKLSGHQLLNEASQNRMFEPATYTNSPKQFAYGWDMHNLNGHISYGFSGSLVTAYRIFPKDGLSIIFLSNGLTHYYNIENVMNHLVSLVDLNIVDFNNYVFETLLDQISNSDINVFQATYKELQNNKKYDQVNFEGVINALGYQVLRTGDMEKALTVFTLNTREFPNSWNVWDSLAEGYEVSGDVDKAIKNYKHSVALNPENEHGIQKLKALGAKP